KEISLPAKGEEKIVEEAPIIKIVDVIINNAVEGGASDIHIENIGDKVKVRYRVDGVLHTTLTLPLNVFASIVARVKILAKLRLDEKRKPQDGSFSARVAGRKVDFRVSSFPSVYGEKVVLRILDVERGIRSLTDLGMTEKNLTLIKEAIDKPYGLILLTGPTGSGKTTTLYAMLKELDRETNNVVSLEDPVEYSIPGVNQSQVMPEIGYTFAAGLRSILRQDPDIIMVGEIRDKETATLAIQAALTGHLVFSTLHTNTSLGVVPRLVDMGIDPYLIAPTLILTVAQRLVQATCPESKKAIPTPKSLVETFESQFADLPPAVRKEIKLPETVYETVSSAGCPEGTKGRSAIYEMFKVDKTMADVILKNPVESEIYKAARAQGMLTLKEDALLKAVNGQIPMAEVYGLEVF
ncbi:MAG TPA: GspE/PulE family protein, partial [Candidatus Paceibacterota bacterium]|nr:GspE/PulE family protein [Candidatus Paceibacterota bacterium]